MFGKKGSTIVKLPPVRNCFTLAMTDKLVIIINSVKVPKIKKILLYEMKFLVPKYSCLQNPWVRGYRPQIPVLSVHCPQLNLLNPPPRTKFLGTPLLALDLINFESKCALSHPPVEMQHTNNTAPLSAEREAYFVFCDILWKKKCVFNIWNHSLSKKMTTKKVAANCQHLAAITEAQSKCYVFKHWNFFKLSLILTF